MDTNQAPAGARAAIIEDDVPLREALVLFLRVKGWAVDTFGSGEESAGVANWEDFTVVICDFSLPREDGLSVLRRVREASDKVVTVLIAGDSGGDLSARAESAGVDRVLFKPISTMELVESLGALTQNRSGRRSMALASPQ
jgi:DNA-binding response OmpR family regulator